MTKEQKLEVLNKLIPSHGSVSEDKPKLEQLRVVQNFYYDVFNNGGWNIVNGAKEYHDDWVRYVEKLGGPEFHKLVIYNALDELERHGEQDIVPDEVLAYTAESADEYFSKYIEKQMEEALTKAVEEAWKEMKA